MFDIIKVILFFTKFVILGRLMFMEKIIRRYFERVNEAYKLGNTETAYNAPIMEMLTEFDCVARDLSGGRSGTIGENIDIKLWHAGEETSEFQPFAGVEVKKVGGIDNRAKQNILVETKAYGNVILTDNSRWEFWHLDENNKPRMYTGIRLIDYDKGILNLKEENIQLFISLVRDFMLQSPSKIQSSGKLAEYMAIHAQTIRDVIMGILKENDQGTPLINEHQQKLPMFGELYGLYRKIQAELSPELKSNDFADMYAQTIVYGLFIARYNDPTPEKFSRNEALGLLQKESALLKQFFIHITTAQNQHPTLIAVIDKLCELYKLCDLVSLLDKEESRDTIVHFYEDFLNAYDPALRRSLGVFYTPQPIVRYMVSMVDKFLYNEFGIQGGLSNNDTFEIEVPSEEYASSKRKNAVIKDTKKVTVPKVAILDPATGTGTFPAEIIRFVKEKYFPGGKSAFYEEWIEKEDGLISRLIAFEIMMTSYVVAHLKIRRTIDETLGHVSKKQLPSNIFLTNTLAPAHTDKERIEEINLFMDFSGAISDEAYHADTWKNRRPIKVVIGNPPYNGASSNPYDVSAYKTETDGITNFGERKHKLNDDYIKFFRFAEQIIQTNETGILAFISNNGYLDSPTSRGMRASLLRTFDKIYIVNLHGSSRKLEVAPDGSKDENVFNIMQGTAIFIGIKTTGSKSWSNLQYADLYGRKSYKFKQLEDENIEFEEIQIDKKMAYFLPFGNAEQDNYENGVSLSELFPTHVSGLQTNNDKAAIANSRKEIIDRIELVKNSIDNSEIDSLWKKYSTGQTAEKIKNDVLTSDGIVAPLTYRPFDERWTFYSGNSTGWIFRPREKSTMGNLLKSTPTPIGKNIGLIFGKTSRYFVSPFISNTITEVRIFSAQTDYSYIAPLYLYNEISDDWTPNINNKALSILTKNLSEEPSVIDIFDYSYGILYDLSYIKKYDEFLKRGYPRVPIPVDQLTFTKYVKAGSELRKLHLLQTEVSAELTIEQDDKQNMVIENIKFKAGVLNINKNTKLQGINEETWLYKIGGYQVLDKWFKSHKGEVFDYEKYNHISRVVAVIDETIKIQARLK